MVARQLASLIACMLHHQFEAYDHLRKAISFCSILNCDQRRHRFCFRSNTMNSKILIFKPVVEGGIFIMLNFTNTLHTDLIFWIQLSFNMQAIQFCQFQTSMQISLIMCNCEKKLVDNGIIVPHSLSGRGQGLGICEGYFVN